MMVETLDQYLQKTMEEYQKILQEDDRKYLEHIDGEPGGRSSPVG